jgi:hypothetical protein
MARLQSVGLKVLAVNSQSAGATPIALLACGGHNSSSRVTSQQHNSVAPSSTDKHTVSAKQQQVSACTIATHP